MRVEGNECITHGARHSNHGLIPDTKRAYFEAMASGRKIAFYSTPFAIEELERENSALKFEKEALHISLDLDGINGFRCHPGYVDRRLKKAGREDSIRLSDPAHETGERESPDQI